MSIYLYVEKRPVLYTNVRITRSTFIQTIFLSKNNKHYGKKNSWHSYIVIFDFSYVYTYMGWRCSIQKSRMENI